MKVQQGDRCGKSDGGIRRAGERARWGWDDDEGTGKREKELDCGVERMGASRDEGGWVWLATLWGCKSEEQHFVDLIDCWQRKDGNNVEFALSTRE